MSKKFIIAAPSARGYARAAVACGYEVIALDAFADEDTQRVTIQTFKLKMHENGVDENDFKRIFSSINLVDVDGFLYGSLFDNASDLLAWVAERVPLLGNAPEVLKRAKDINFFKLLDDLKITHPEVRLALPEAPSNWLAKKIGGSGGMHIRPAEQAKIGNYFQRKVAGTSISMLFVADGKSAQTIDFNQQLVAPTNEMPYRFAGAVGAIALQPNICATFKHAAQQLTSALSLRGLNNLDAILDGETLWILELNPRLSATFHLYENLLHLHLEGCAGKLIDFKPQANTSNAQLILYADDDLGSAADFTWPDWVTDIPSAEGEASSVKISQNTPICSVLAQAENAEAAHVLVQQRAKKLREMLNDKTRHLPMA